MRLLLLVLLLLVVPLSSTHAQTDTRPLIPPVQGPPGPEHWLFGQAYGNTTGAYNNGTRWYSAGQGLHFGIDLSMPCGTPLVAVADGEVLFVDNMSFGSAPHNLLIGHRDLGLVSLYGHLLDTPNLQPGQLVQQGDVIAQSGTPDSSCDSRPHLHYELRSPNYGTTYNPLAYMDANWHSLALIGPFSYPLFAADLNNARQWMTLDDQPDVVFGGRRLNDYFEVYPPSGDRRPPTDTPASRDLPEPTGTWTARMYAGAGCCWLHFWHPTDPNRLYVVDGGPNQRAFLTAWDVSSGQAVGEASADIPYMAPDGIHELWHTGSNIVMRDNRDGTMRTLFTGGTIPSVSPDGTRLMWITRAGDNVPGQEGPPTTVWMSGIDGENGEIVLSDRGFSAQWLDSSRLLIGRSGEGRTRSLSVYNIGDGSTYDLGTWTNMRGQSVAPGGGQVIFYLSFQENPANNGVYVIDTQPGAAAQQLPWFGAYRWRDDDSLYYIPFDAGSAVHSLHYYSLATGEDRALTDPATTPFSVMNGDWEVSADGRRIVFHDALTQALTLLEMAG